MGINQSMHIYQGQSVSKKSLFSFLNSLVGGIRPHVFFRAVFPSSHRYFFHRSLSLCVRVRRKRTNERNEKVPPQVPPCPPSQPQGDNYRSLPLRAARPSHRLRSP